MGATMLSYLAILTPLEEAMNKIAPVFLGLIALIGSLIIAKGLSPRLSQVPSVTPPEEANYQSVPETGQKASLTLFSEKKLYSLNEEIPVQIIIKGEAIPVTAIQTNINYGPSLILTSSQAQGLLPELNYHPNVNVVEKNELQLAAITKNPQQPLYFDNPTPFAKMIFKAKRVGKAKITLGDKTGVFIQGETENYLNKTSILEIEVIP